MRKNRYVEKKFLCRYDLSKEFFDNLGIEIEDITPVRKVYVLKTPDKGKKVLKKVDYDENKIEFIYNSLTYVNKNFPYIMKMNKLRDNDTFVKWNDENYILMDLIEGREACVTNPIELEICGEAVALMHKSSIGIEDYLSSKVKTIIRNPDLVNKYKECEEDIKKIKEWVLNYKYKNEFDKLFLENCDKCLEDIRLSRKLLDLSNYKNLINDKELICLCHNDLANHNFLIEDEKINIIDFDYATIGLRTLDVADFLLKWIKNSVFNINKGDMFLDSYNNIFKLKDDEYELIHAIMTFPRDIYSTISSYYHKAKEWDEEVFLHRFKIKLENEVFRKKFIEDFKEKYLK
ncbi:spore coat protein [Clostridium baratii]|uniref:CotS family spore coat protein n=1 Tax=Clostridium baratii TaxID=1561 RepID=UPI0009A46245|nr:CotS family spore coat protein [Clostridium baratii]OPF52868.1 spore coat protein [Clostridium baratii]OPF56315.1 spore coat protein [Clostridium baratii]OPF58090.1 spore coat protein [Clostridium baratii]OPF59303.1 spore coat protein [Clostridium baratii]